MKKLFFPIHQHIVALSAVLLMVVLLAACKKDSVNDPGDLQVAHLMAFNLAPDKSAVSVSLSGNQLPNLPLDYTNYTGLYQNIYPGERLAESYDHTLDSLIFSENYTFDVNEYYSLFVVGNKGVYKNVIVNDDFDSVSAASGKAYIRYINAIPDSSAPAVVITSNGNELVNSPAAYTTVSDFIPADAGEITMSVNNGGSIATDRTITLESGKVYTALLIGVPDDPNMVNAVQIKYIENGTAQ